MEWTENILQISFLTGGIFALAGMIQYVFRPKEINGLYGYRTKSSMASDERWHFAQNYSALKMIASGVFLVVFSTITLIVDMGINSTDYRPSCNNSVEHRLSFLFDRESFENQIS